MRGIGLAVAVSRRGGAFGTRKMRESSRDGWVGNFAKNRSLGLGLTAAGLVGHQEGFAGARG